MRYNHSAISQGIWPIVEKILSSYSEALDYIYGFTNYEIKPGYRYSPDVIDPFREFEVLELIGEPHQSYPSIHIAGTKGKGSVAALCASVLQAAGLRTGLYTSPHLVSFTERIKVDGQEIEPDEVVQLVADLRPFIDQVAGITTFETMTALAFAHFRRRQVDVAVIEVGMGGRLDATNVVTPLVSVITTLGYDHTHLFGNTLHEIAGEKAGIIKEKVPVVCAPQAAEALEVVEQKAAECQAPLTLVGQDWWFESEQSTLDGQVFKAGPAGEPGETYRTPLLGRHQALNATVALAALDVVKPHFEGLDDNAIKSGFAQVRWPGRLQILSRRPVVVLDGAHNIDSAQALAAALNDLFPERRRILVIGVTGDKDVNSILSTLIPLADTIVATQAQHPRGMPVDELAQRFKKLGADCHSVPGVANALQQALQLAGPDDVVCVTGSLYVVGDTLAAWQNNEGASTEQAPVR